MKVYPNNIPEHDIYDVFYANGRIHIYRPPNKPKVEVKLNGKVSKGYSGHIQEYSFAHPYVEKVELEVEGEKFLVDVRTYDNLKDEVALCTMVKNEDNYIVQWIEYHLLVGFKKFVIYDNKNSPNTRYKSDETDSDLENVLADYIKKGIVMLIEWPYPKNYLGVNTSSQKVQQHHCLTLFKKAKYLGFIDIDEYINISNFKDQQIEGILDKLIQPRNAGVQLWCKFFQNNEGKSEKGYDFLKITNFFYCINGDPNKPRYANNNSPKFIIVPSRVNACAIHNFGPMKGYRSNVIKSYESLYFNHYYFLNKRNLKKWRCNRKCIHNDDTLTHYYDKLFKEKEQSKEDS
tara:strand:+ start:3991 stop:5028 length:1038 start_codon:yes stop_codon:yes gene_type:complete